MSSLRFSVALAIAVSSPAVFAQTSTALDAKVQVPELKAPERASLVGQLATVVFGPGDVTRGSFTLAPPFAVPQERGAMLASPFPSYSIENGISEWGLGWQATFAITRMRVQGDLDYATDDLASPFGRLVKGTDGSWYPLGMSTRVRVVESADTLTAYLPDGTRMTFGGAARVTTSRGTYSWHLTEVTTVTGRKTRIDWTANPSGRLFATCVSYGGIGEDYQYRVDLAYEPLATPFEDYRSGQMLALDRRVTTATVLAKNASTGVFEERWHYELGYDGEGFGPGYYLVGVQQVFRSGDRPPPAIYSYFRSSEKLASAALVTAPAVTALLSATAANVLQPDRSTLFDIDDDGRSDLEWGYDYRLARQTDAGFVIEALPAASDAYTPYCRKSPGTLNPPRVIAQLQSGAGNDTEYVVDLHTDTFGTTTYFNACNRLGQRQGSVTIAGSWALGPTVRLVDLNRDHKPDVLRVQSGQYRVLPNTSTASTFSFGAVRTGSLAPAFTPDTVWVHDFNGDGIPDLIARTSSQLYVWYGKGNLDFVSPARTFALRTASGTYVTTLSSYGLTFVDANKDGLTDLVLSGASGNETHLFMNRGSYFEEATVPALQSVDAFTSRPVLMSTTGSGSTELTFTRSGEGLAVALDDAGTGLMASADDGRGTLLAFEYGRAAPSPGGKSRQTVVARMTQQSSGQGSVAYDFAYGTPRLHSLGKFLLGYDEVQRTTPLEVEWASFVNTDWQPSTPLESTSRDSLVSGLERYTHTTTEDAIFQGIPWKRPVQTETGWRTTDGTGLKVADVTRTTGWWGDFCQAQVVKDTSAGTLTLDTQYAMLASFTGHLACLPADITETGTHVDPELDFTYGTAISRNDVGLVTRVSSVAGPGDVWTLQDVTYTPEWLVETVSAPGQGTTTATYDPITRLLNRVTSPEGAVVEAAGRDPITNATTLLRTTRGVLVHEQHFAFDGQERLQSAWDNVGSGSQYNPDAQFAYQFATATAPASISASVLIDTASASVRETVDLLTASGQPVAAGKRIPEGWALMGLTWRDGAIGQTTAYVGPAIAMTTLVGLDYGTLFGGANVIQATTAGPFGVATDHTVALHADVQRRVVESLSIDSTTMRLVKNARENGTFDRTVATDASNGVLASWDEAGTGWGYVHDALGRVREVQLADGKKHRARYDGHGRPSRVEREGIATVEYAYDPVTGLLQEKRFISPGGTLWRRVTILRDGFGRTEREIHSDVVSGGSKTFRYYFDGATPENTSATNAIGLVTAVVGDGYVKRFDYRDDGKIAKRTLSIGSWRTIVTSLLYNEAGEPAGQSVSVLSGDAPLVATSISDQYDVNGRVRATTFGSSGSASYTYDSEGRTASVALPVGSVSFAYDDYTKRLIGSTQTSPAYTASTLQRMNERGLPGSEVLQVGALSLSRQYGYSDQRFLTSSADAQSSYGYSFDRSGLPTRIVENAALTDLVSSGNTLVAGPLIYVFDDLGRTIQRGDLVLAYGPDGQIASATRGARTWTFIHDEAGQRLAKLENGIPVAAYPSDGYLDATQLVEPIQLGGRAVGVLKNGIFETIATDLRGTVLADADGSPRIASPFGTRDVRPSIAPALDYVEKGFDADLGLVRMGARDYDPHINRFTTPDPMFLEEPERCAHSPLECNLYAYALGRPSQIVDPTGLGDPIDVIGPVAANRDYHWNRAAELFRQGDALSVAGGVAEGMHWAFWGAVAAPALIAQGIVEPVNAPALQIRGQLTGNASDFFGSPQRLMGRDPHVA